MPSNRSQEYPASVPVTPFEEWLFEKYSPPEGRDRWEFTGDGDPETLNTYSEYIVRTWEDPKRWLVDNFSLDLIGEVLSYEFHVYGRKQVARPLRDRAWDAVSNLFVELFEPYVSDCLSHLDEKDPVAGMLDGTCYMWWGESSPYAPHWSGNSDRDNEIFWNICTRGLESRRPPIQESILHGLAHILNGFFEMERPHQLIDWFLTKNLAARPELITYAKLADLAEVQ